MLIGLTLMVGLAAVGPAAALAPSVTADLDGDGQPETVAAVASRGAVGLQVRDAGGRKTSEATAPSPNAEVVHIALASASLGSAGALVAVSASTDALECVSVWRYRGAALTRLPIRGGDGKDAPDCVPAGRWTDRWEQEAEGRPSVLVRERTEQVAQGSLRIREVFTFAGFSLDYDSGRSVREINGVPIPSWYAATLYTRAALEKLYGRFDLASLKSEPTLSILTDRERGVFALRFTDSRGETVAPVDGFAWTPASHTASLSGRAGGKTAHVSVRLGGDGTVPYEARVEGLGTRLDQTYAPAGSWRGGSRQVFPSASDELASEDLVGVWDDPRGRKTTIEIDGAPPYRLRMGGATFTIDTEHATPPIDLLLIPADGPGRPWGLVLRGPNTIDRVPFACAGQGAERACRPEGDAESLRRIGALMNVR